MKIRSTAVLKPSLLIFFAHNALAGEDAALDLNIEDLLNVEVTSVSKKAQSLSDSAAAIFVISNEDIKRSGVTSIPEALRMAPGMDVSRIDSNKWAISARGFNGRFANKLLVLIDGRTVYSPSFSGVYWEAQDVMLEDVMRIEVIRGPGAALWGANAVNGVINIITRHAADSQGGLFTAGGGTQEQGFGALRYGIKIGEETFARAYVKGYKRDEFKTQSGADASDDWSTVKGGFRLDSQWTTQDSLTVQGDAYHGNINQHINFATLTPPDYSQSVFDEVETSGWNVLTRLQHNISATDEFAFQFYYDRTERKETIEHETRNTLDLDFQHRFKFGDRNDIIWGLGYRYSHDDFEERQYLLLTPESRNDQVVSGFVQDELALIENHLWLTLGSKFEHNDYTGFEYQPNARLMWAPYSSHRVWASVSRAVRTPSRAEHDVALLNRVIAPGTAMNPSPFPVGIQIQGSRDFKSEELLAYELGYRVTFAKTVSLDITAFYNDYDNVGDTQVGTASFRGTHIIQPAMFVNSKSGETYGTELSLVWQAAEWLRWDLNYSFLRSNFVSSNSNSQTAISPQHQLSLRTLVSPWNSVKLDYWLRYVGEGKALNGTGGDEIAIDDYITLDIRLAWQPVDAMDLAVVGQNLLDSQHLEYVQESFTQATEVPRGVFVKLDWRF